MQDSSERAIDNSCRYNIGFGVSYEMSDSDGSKQVTLKIFYQSDIPFDLEIGLLKNFKPKAFSIKQNGEYKLERSFLLSLDKTDENLNFCNLELEFEDCLEEDNLILWIKNKKTFLRSPKGMRFLRLSEGTKDKIPETASLRFEPSESHPNFITGLTPLSVSRQGDSLMLDLLLEPQKLYDNDENITKENPTLQFDFLLLAMQGDCLVPLDGCNYRRGRVSISEASRFQVLLKENGEAGEPLTLFLLPYPYLDYNKAEHIQKVLYNSSTYVTVQI